MANRTQSDGTIRSLLIIAFVIPAVVTLVHMVLQMFYGLSDKRLEACMVDVRARRAEKAAKAAQAAAEKDN